MAHVESAHLDLASSTNSPDLNAEPREVGAAAALFVTQAFELTLATHTSDRVHPEPMRTTTAADETVLLAVCNELIRRQSPQDRGAYFARGAVVFAALGQEALLNEFEDECLKEGRGKPGARKRLAQMSMGERLVGVPLEYVRNEVVSGALLESAVELIRLRNWLSHPTRTNVPKAAKHGVRTKAAAHAVLTVAGVGVVLAEARSVAPDNRIRLVLEAADALRDWATRVDRHIPLPPPEAARTIRFGGPLSGLPSSAAYPERDAEEGPEASSSASRSTTVLSPRLG